MLSETAVDQMRICTNQSAQISEAMSLCELTSTPVMDERYWSTLKLSSLQGGNFSKIFEFPDGTLGKLVLRGDAQKEVRILRRISQVPNVVQILGEFLVDGRVMIHQPFGGPNLFSCVDDVSVQSCVIIMCQLVRALSHLHCMWIVHRDIKLENVVFDGQNAVLIDFGLAHEFSQDDTGMLSDATGSLHYLPPEVFAMHPYNAYKSDVWATGVVLFGLLFKNFPFKPPHPDNNVYSKMLNLQQCHNFSPLDSISTIYQIQVDHLPEWKQMLDGMLEHDSNKRFTIMEVACEMDKIVQSS